MGTILERLENTKRAMQIEEIRDALGLDLQQAAIDAMMEGLKKGGKWEQYMSLFADNLAQLERLTVVQADDPSWLRETRAYMVANAICGATSTTDTSLRFDTQVNGLFDNQADGNIVEPGQEVPEGGTRRPFTIPNVPA